ncbi:hypothetical protein BN873_100022 [Candidatus Competibacter denitrificans Run_A_D11]|uniref:Hemerythrin-like domain-containing protein n=1 Tax=Candidatus Competibacter denitrificans Run_A_D11 TaxID=1400863 RepID=W6M5G0_9GAMM|nr:bacteriohemerythrin [Candidatus Competibacter denitrificans]CDI01010.1 hypothetical protein BN873_100022 [Candidatus Competibacter denitrificans Run_A_D11]HAS87612.1 hypothetical protein [Candidatus Competibacteraceae bacterium]
MSDYVNWNPGISLGISEIDLEHQTFVVIINELDKNKANPVMAQRIVQALVRYAAFHFQSEENIMFAARYPGLEAHRSTHLHLLEDLNIVMVDLKTEADYNYEPILSFFKDWYVNHTSKADMRFAEFLNRQALAKDQVSQPTAVGTSTAPPRALKASNLSSLSLSILERFAAVLATSQMTLHSLIEEIQPAKPVIAAKLTRLLNNQDYTTITTLVQTALQARLAAARPVRSKSAAAGKASRPRPEPI